MLKLEIIGNIGRDAEIFSANDGKQYMSFSLAAETNGKNNNTIWIDCTMNASESLKKYLTKGTSVYISGRPNARCYTNKNGEIVPSLGCFVHDLQLLGGSKSKEAQQQEQNANVPF